MSRPRDNFTLAAGRALAEHSRDIVLLMTPDGELRYANAAASFAYRRPANELLGMNIRDLRAPSTRPLVATQMSAASEEGVLFETFHLRADGTEFPVEVSSRGVEIEGERYLLSVVRDISRRYYAQQESAELLVELEAANRQLEGLLRIVSSTVGRVDLDQLLSSVLSVLREVMDADAAIFFTLEEGRWRLRAQEGYPEEDVRDFSMATDEGFASRVAEAGEPFWLGDVTASPARIPAHEQFGVKAMLGVPLYLEGELFGVVECAWATDRLMSDAERVMLQVAADRITAAVLGAQRFERTARSQHFEESLSEISALLNSSHQLETPIVLALQIGCEALGCDAAAFGRMAGDAFEIVTAVGVETGSIPLPGHSEFQGNRDVVWIGAGDAQTPLGESFLAATGLAQCAIVPVAVSDEWFGAVLFGSVESGSSFDEAELEFARRFAKILGSAYTNAADYQSEHHISQTLQEALLTLEDEGGALRVGHLYRSATLSTRVGGDFYDIFAMSGGRRAVLMGDVSGKGLEAAVVTSFIKNTVRAFAHGDTSPAAVMSKTNEVLVAAGRLPDFASVVLMAVDPQERSVTYCSAGHPPSVVVRADGTTARLESGSPVIGAFTDLDYTEETLVLEAGDIVVLYTDGVTEARSADGGFFGEERLLEALEKASGLDPAEVPGLVNDAVMRFTGGRLSDDIALLAFSIA